MKIEYREIRISAPGTSASRSIHRVMFELDMQAVLAKLDQMRWAYIAFVAENGERWPPPVIVDAYWAAKSVAHELYGEWLNDFCPPPPKQYPRTPDHVHAALTPGWRESSDLDFENDTTCNNSTNEPMIYRWRFNLATAAYAVAFKTAFGGT